MSPALTDSRRDVSDPSLTIDANDPEPPIATSGARSVGSSAKAPARSDTSSRYRMKGIRRRSWGATSALVLLRDRWAGRRDGKRGLPVVAGVDPGGTPRLAEIHRTCQAHVDRIRLDVVAACAEDRVREVELEKYVIPRALERRAEAERRLDALRREGVRPGRRLGEDRLPQDLLDRRREQEAGRRLARAMKRLEDERTEVLKAQGELEATRRRLLDMRHAAHAQAEQVHAWASRRATRYLQGAQRRHPDRATFAAVFSQFLPVAPTREQWLSATRLETS